MTQVHHFLDSAAAAIPDGPVLALPDRTWSYTDLAQAAHRIAGRLVDHGLRRGDRVVMLFRNGFEYAAVYYGILKAGGVCVSLDPAIGRTGLEYILRDCAPLAVIHDRAAAARSVGGVRVWPEETRVLLHDGSCAGEGGPEVQEKLAGVLAGAPSGTSIPGGGEEDLASIVYTSGTTGRPKGAMLTHRNLVSNTRAIVDYLGLTRRDRILAVLPFYYVYGKSLLNTHVAVGGTVIVENRFLFPTVVLERMQSEEATGFAGVPSTFNILLKRTAFAEMAFPALRYVTQAGGAMAPAVTQALMNALPDKKIYIMYGATEASARLSYLDPADLLQKTGSIGKSISGVDLFPIRPDGTPCEPGEEGELVARGPNIMRGYWNDPDETARVLRDGLYHTGDLGHVDGEGFLYIAGRSRSMIKVGGGRVSPQEIEDAISELPDVVETAVIGVKDEVLGEAAKAFAVIRPDAAITPLQIEKFLKKRLAPFKVPKQIVLVDRLPKNPAGKILRTQLPTLEVKHNVY